MVFLAFIGLITLIYTFVYLILPWFLDCDLKLAYYEKFGKPINTLRGKVVWITGASAGIGENLAYVLAEVHCKLILTARRKSELERVKANCLSRNKQLQDSDIEIYAFDICNLDTHESTLEQILNKFGRLDILVNNAGRSQRATWENIDIRVDREMFELNVLSHVALSRVVAKYFLKVGQGHFAVTSSVAGINSVPFSGSYCGTKHALHGYFNSWSIEKLDKHIPVTMVCPGPIQTDFLPQSFTDKYGEKYGVDSKVDQGKISPARCATLMAVAIANELYEVWICKTTVLQIMYLVKYYPNVGLWLVQKLGPRFLLKLRDAKTTIEQED